MSRYHERAGFSPHPPQEGGSSAGVGAQSGRGGKGSRSLHCPPSLTRVWKPRAPSRAHAPRAPRPTWAVRGNSSSSAQAGAGTEPRASSSSPSTSAKRHWPATPSRVSTCGEERGRPGAPRPASRGHQPEGGAGPAPSVPPPQPGRSRGLPRPPPPLPTPAGAMTQHKARPTRGSREARAPESSRQAPRPRELGPHSHLGTAPSSLPPLTVPQSHPPTPMLGQREGAWERAGRRWVPARQPELMRASALALPGEEDRGSARRHSLCSASERQMQRKKYKNKTGHRGSYPARIDPLLRAPPAAMHLTLTSGLISIGLSCIFANRRRSRYQEKRKNSKRSRPGCRYKAPA